ncbi:MAG: lytic transglycosylase domain-containing protein [Candidatus Promineofilum sp.]|mgnify:CR=1 FL=1|nr:lytic transglycosylase domain-containing protein [Promineifilum sp.]MCW5861710.1 lytic transglycosylase domain-containing protein [Anaerolineae bacterium]
MLPRHAPDRTQYPRRWPLPAALLALLAGVLAFGHVAPAAAATPPATLLLSPYWGPDIQRWAGPIHALARAYGFHPDFIAAVIQQETDGERPGVSRRGRAGLMGLLPGAAWRPSAEALLGPANDLRWGMAVLSYVVQQAGGDLYTALAAFNGGWQAVGSRPSSDYAAAVLDSFARALLVRAGLPPESATRWTVAVVIRAGNVPEESLLVLGHKPIGPLHTFAYHTVYAFADEAGRAYTVSGYVVPVGLSELVVAESGRGSPDELEAPLRVRLGEKDAGSAIGSPHVLLACLAQMERLRGRMTTRWFAPSGCPPAER